MISYMVPYNIILNLKNELTKTAFDAAKRVGVDGYTEQAALERWHVLFHQLAGFMDSIHHIQQEYYGFAILDQHDKTVGFTRNWETAEFTAEMYPQPAIMALDQEAYEKAYKHGEDVFWDEIQKELT